MAEYLKYLQSMYNSETSKRKLAYLRHNFQSFLRPGMRVLELGPGLGEFLGLAQSLGITDIDIVDRDSAVLEYLRKTYPVTKAWLTELEQIETISKQLRGYDCIFMLQIMEHVRTEALPALLRTLYRSLNPGGVMLITVPNGGNPLSIVERYSDITHHNVFTENSLKQLVAMAEFDSDGDTILPHVSVRGYCIPPNGALALLRRTLQKVLHLCLKGLLIVNGGVYFSVYEPNITLVVRKPVIRKPSADGSAAAVA